MMKKIKGIISVAISILIASCTSVTVVENSEQPDVSGETVTRASRIETLEPVFDDGDTDSNLPFALKSITWAERGDRPCFFKATFQSVTNPDNIKTSDKIKNCDAPEGEFSEYGLEETHFLSSLKTVELVDPGDVFHPAYFLQVCAADGWRSSQNKIKGIRLKGRSLLPNNTTFTIDEKTRPNCAEWQPASECPAGSYISAVRVHFDLYEAEGNQDSALIAVGMQPVCSHIEELTELLESAE